MAGIVSAKKMKKEGMDIAIVKAVGFFVYDCNKLEYYVLELYNKKGDLMGLETLYIYQGGDVQIENGIVPSKVISLHILDDYTASWEEVIDPKSSYSWFK